MRNLLLWIQIAVSVLLVTAILFQQKGAGLGAAFGGSGQIYRSKRGVEKSLFIGTIILTILFVAIALFNLIIK